MYQRLGAKMGQHKFYDGTEQILNYVNPKYNLLIEDITKTIKQTKQKLVGHEVRKADNR